MARHGAGQREEIDVILGDGIDDGRADGGIAAFPLVALLVFRARLLQRRGAVPADLRLISRGQGLEAVAGHAAAVVRDEIQVIAGPVRARILPDAVEFLQAVRQADLPGQMQQTDLLAGIAVLQILQFVRVVAAVQFAGLAVVRHGGGFFSQLRLLAGFGFLAVLLIAVAFGQHEFRRPAVAVRQFRQRQRPEVGRKDHFQRGIEREPDVFPQMLREFPRAGKARAEAPGERCAGYFL